MADSVIDLAPLDGATETDSTSTDTSTQTEQTFDSTTTDQQQQGNQDSKQQTDSVDGRKGPQNIRNSIKAASEAIPEQAEAFKQLGNAYFREQAYKQHFPTPQEAASAKQLIEGIGGVEGAATLTQRIQGYDAQDEALRSGSPEVLDAFFKDFADGAVALAPHYLDKLQQTNPQAFTAAIAPHAIALLESSGVGGHLQAILNETDPARAKALVQQLAEWYKGQTQNVAQIKANGTARKDPAAEKLAKDREAFETEKEGLFKSGVSERVNAAATPVLSAEVDKYAKQYKLNDTQKAHFQESLQAAVIKEMNGDATYKKQVDLRYANKGRTHDTVASYISGEFNRRVKEKAFEVAKAIYGAPRNGTVQQTGQVRAGGTQTAPGGGPLFVSQRPPDSELDLNKSDAEMNLIKGRAWTKAGKFVTWRRQTA